MKNLMLSLGIFLLLTGPASSGAAKIAERIEQYGSAARERLKPYFEQQRVSYPPTELVFVGLKEEKSLEIYARTGTGGFNLIRAYPLLAASGEPGPKLEQGDFQVPEGIYNIELLNPNSNYHLSLRIGYPNKFDRAQAAREKRTRLGGDIMIHGRAVSAGCLAMGDEAAEDLFVLAADTGIEKITVILSPVDFRAGKSAPKVQPNRAWTAALYREIKTRLATLPRANPEWRPAPSLDLSIAPTAFR